MIPQSDAALVLCGWKERRLRVLFRGEPLDFSAFCALYEVREDIVSFTIADDPKSMIGFRVDSCICGFTDPPRDVDNNPLPVGGTIESAILFIRRHPLFELTIMLLEERDDGRVDT